MDKRAQKEIEEHLEESARIAEAQLQELQERETISMECADPQSERERREQRRYALSEDYERALRDALGEDIRHIHRTPRGLVIYMRDDGRLSDHGSRIEAFKMDDETAARRLIALAVAKGWKSIAVAGSRGFVRRAMEIAIQNGLLVVPRDAMQAGILQELLSARGGAVGATATAAPEIIQAPGAPGLRDDLSARLRLRREQRNEPCPSGSGGPKPHRP